MTDVKERNKEVKRILSKVFGNVNVSVTGGKGTAYGWCHIDIKVNAPCSQVISCRECADLNANACKVNKNPITGGWGDSARQILTVETEKKADEAIKNCEFYTYVDDMNSNHREVIMQVKFI